MASICESGNVPLPAEGQRKPGEGQRHAGELARRSRTRGLFGGLHAAQAFIIESTGRQTKSHRGVQRELARLTKDDSGFDLEMRAFLGQTYNLKAIADYETGPGSIVSPEQAAKAVAEGIRFVTRLTAMVEAIGA